MDINEIGHLLKSIKPIQEQKEEIEKQIKQLNPSELEKLSPLIEQVRESSPKMSVEELLKKAEEITKSASNASKQYNNKS
jgi:HEPN domain-containing protein